MSIQVYSATTIPSNLSGKGFEFISREFLKESHLLPVSPEDLELSFASGCAVIAFDGDLPVGYTRILPLASGFYELGSTWVHSDFRRRGINLLMYKTLLPAHEEKQILATTDNSAALEVGKQMDFVRVPRRTLPEEVWRASCCCPLKKTMASDNGACVLAWSEPQAAGCNAPCVFRVTAATARRLKLVSE